MSLQEFVDELVKIHAGPDAGMRYLQELQGFKPKPGQTLQQIKISLFVAFQNTVIFNPESLSQQSQKIFAQLLTWLPGEFQKKLKKRHFRI